MLSKANEVLCKIEQYFIGISLLLITAILFINVVLRRFGFSIDGVDEISRYGIVWVTFIGASVCIYKGSHIGVDAILMIIPKKKQIYLTTLTITISLIFAVIFTYLSFNITRNIHNLGQTSSTLEISMIYIYGAMPVGGVLMIIRYSQELWKNMLEIKKEVS